MLGFTLCVLTLQYALPILIGSGWLAQLFWYGN